MYSASSWLLVREPNLERIVKAVEESAAGLPVTQYTVDTGEPIVVIRDYPVGSIYVMAGGRLLTHFRVTPDPARPRTVSAHVDERADVGKDQGQ